MTLALADCCPTGRVVSVLEGGYSLEARVSRAKAAQQVNNGELLICLLPVPRLSRVPWYVVQAWQVPLYLVMFVVHVNRLSLSSVRRFVVGPGKGGPTEGYRRWF